MGLEEKIYMAKKNSGTTSCLSTRSCTAEAAEFQPKCGAARHFRIMRIKQYYTNDTSFFVSFSTF